MEVSIYEVEVLVALDDGMEVSTSYGLHDCDAQTLGPEPLNLNPDLRCLSVRPSRIASEAKPLWES